MGGTQIHWHHYHAGATQPVSANRFRRNANFCGLGWRFLAFYRLGCLFPEIASGASNAHSSNKIAQNRLASAPNQSVAVRIVEPVGGFKVLPCRAILSGRAEVVRRLPSRKPERTR